LWLERETGLLSGKLKVESGKSANAKSISHNQLSTFSFQLSTFLHIAPEVCLSRKFEKIFPADNYITLDLESPLAKIHADVQALPFPDGTFDVVFCNHVLEHVADDRLAMREMWRVMRPGGWGVMLSPVDPARATTFEDDTIADPAERTRIFGQYDHRRIYGRDYADRLREAGRKVEEIDYLATLTPGERRRYALLPEILYVVKKII
jgi:SAM-dependent methyltransferase